MFLLFFFTIIYFYNKYKNECVVLQTIKLDDINIEIVDDTCKEGLPHTTDSRTIRMTRSIWKGPRFDNVLRHERVHLSQKGARRTDWLDFYEREWGYKCSATPPPGIPGELVTKRRQNPDTDDCPWAVWRGRYVFFPAFGTDKTLRGAEVIVWDLERNRQCTIPEEWRAEFCSNGKCPNQYEHPHEISAEWITDGPSVIKAPAAYKLFAWDK